jgi:4-amino-4-deoxy-L-arabinose transferase-like glycosyltransferase
LYTSAFTLLAITLMTYSGYVFTTFGDEIFPLDAVVLLLAGVIVLGLAVSFSRRLTAQPADFADVPRDAPLTRSRRLVAALSALVGIVLVAIVTEISGMALDIPAFAKVSIHVQIALFTVGVLLVGWGFGGAPVPLRLFRSWREIDRREALILLGILGVALFLRAWDMDQTLRVLIDEVHFSDAIRRLNWDPNTPILSPMSGTLPFSWLYSYGEAGMAQLFGTTLFGLRILSPVVGMLTVLALWGLARVLFDRQTALLAAILLAVFPPHLHYSRIGLLHIADPLFGTIALFFIARALRDNRRLDWSFAGVMLGLTQYFFEGGRLFFIPLAGLWLVILILTNRKRLRGYLGGIGIMVVTTVIISLPYYYVIVALDKPLAGRMDSSGLGVQYWREFFAEGVTRQELDAAVRRLTNPFMFYVHHPEAQAAFYGGDQPLVLEPLLPIFLLGVGYVLWQWRRPAVIALLWAVATAIANGLFIRDNMVSARYVVVLPALALLMAVPLRYVPQMVFNASHQAGKPPKLIRAGIIGLVGAMCILQVYYYFGSHLEYFNRQARDFKAYGDGIDVSLRVAALPNPYIVQPYIVAMPDHDQNVPRNFLGYLITTDYYPLLSARPDFLTPKYLINLPRDRDYAFFVDVTSTSVVDLIYRYFPNIQTPQYTTTDMRPNREYVLLYAPRSLYDLYRPVKGAAN